ncbi:MAG TPA: hypothetical protein VFW45_09265 [Candidatus Polarisedimenticolia bacterium]|nr:hypothetical protein [Candidatus Polarisedimenticolia bacterium]
MKKAVLLALLLLPALGLVAWGGDDNSQGDNDNHRLPAILAFDTMYGVEGPLLGSANAIRGVVGDEAPWEIAHFIRGRLDTSGRLKIAVRGLVFADDPLSPPDFIGKNDEPTFRAVVSCLTESPQETIVVANVTTDPFPASLQGDSFIQQKLDLPNPCIAPIIFVIAGSEDKWFAVTGFEAEEGGEESAHHHR